MDAHASAYKEQLMSSVQSVPAVTPIEERGYAHPEVLVSTDWVAQHLDDPKVRLVESNEDLLLYDTGHIPGAVKIDWTNDLNDPVVRDYVNRQALQRLLRSKGINQDTTIVFYGDKNNWWATYALWVLQLFGLTNVKVMDGGRLRWIDEGRPLSTDRPATREGNITIGERDDSKIRAFRDEVLNHLKQKGQLVDVRSPGARRPTCRNTRRRAASAAATFRGPRVFPGRRRSIPTPTPSGRPASSRSCTSRKTRFAKMRRRSRIAGSASAHLIPGSRSPIYSASTTYGTTTDRGLSGAMRSVFR
jgi:rhodanese-related sulfurtransferase